jgi:hypothetical protein
MVGKVLKARPASMPATNAPEVAVTPIRAAAGRARDLKGEEGEGGEVAGRDADQGGDRQGT